MKNPIRLKFSSVRDWISLLAGLVTICGVPLIIFELLDIKQNQYDPSTQLLGIFDQQIYSGSSLRVRHAIESGGPLLEEHGGPVTDDELEDYLNIFESISDARNRYLIDEDMLYNLEGYYFEKAYLNAEVREYISEVRKEDPDFYSGFEELAKKFLKEDNIPAEPEIKNPPKQSRSRVENDARIHGRPVDLPNNLPRTKQNRARKLKIIAT